MPFPQGDALGYICPSPPDWNLVHETKVPTVVAGTYCMQIVNPSILLWRVAKPPQQDFNSYPGQDVQTVLYADYDHNLLHIEY